MRGVLKRIKANAADPLRYEASILSRGQMLVRTAATLEQALPCFAVARPQMVVHRLPCDLRQFEPDGATRLSLTHVRPVDRVAVRRHIIDLQRHEIAATQLAVDGEIEQC
jgi:hypothetical protein